MCEEKSLRELDDALVQTYRDIVTRFYSLDALAARLVEEPGHFGILDWVVQYNCDALFESCVLALARFWDPVREPKSNRNSILSVLQHRPALEALAGKREEICVGFLANAPNSSAAIYETPQKAVQNLFDRIRSVSVSVELNNLKGFRDGFVAHNLNLEWRNGRQVLSPYRDLKNLMLDTEFCFLRIRGILQENTVVWDSFVEEAKEADRFWKKIYDLQREWRDKLKKMTL